MAAITKANNINFKPEEFATPIRTFYQTWLDELTLELREQADKFERILNKLLPADRVFTVAVGRSNLMLLNAGMRLLHAGFNLYEVSAYYTPALGNDPKYNDVVAFSSGSGKTKLVLTTLTIAKEKGVYSFGVSSNPDSEAVAIAGKENVIITKGKRIYPSGQVPKERNQPMNFLQTKSEFKSLCIFEILVNEIAKAKGLTEEDFRKRHANTE